MPRTLLALVAIALSALTAHAQATAPSEIAATTSGPIRGVVHDRINVFKGIPYGDDTAKHRFQPPVPPAPWTTVRDCLDFGPMPPQNTASGGITGGRGGFFPNPIPDTPGARVSEDCLTLNVWTPALRDRQKRPVMVYFHGGAYNNGSVNVDLYDGTALCTRGDVVVVTVNGRLNGFGFLYLAELCGPKYADSGNVGMLDLFLALRWVHDNIAEFGGDPANVTIFGQSGGGAKCSTLMAMPAARGLFHKVITMSGQQITGRTREHATATARAVLDKLHLTPGQIDKVDTLTTQELVTALRGGTWTPVVDGRVLPRDPFSPDASPLSADIPMMKGNTREETASLIGGGDRSLDTLTWEALPARLDQQVKQYLGTLTAEQVVARYRDLYPSYSPSDVFFAATTAARSWKSFLVEVESRARQHEPHQAPLYVYQLDWRTPVDGGRWRACHTLDLPLAFHNLVTSMVGDPNDTETTTMADQVSAAFLAFAKTGNPTTPPLPNWPPYTLDARSTLIFNLAPKIENDPRRPERLLFKDIPYVQPGT